MIQPACKMAAKADMIFYGGDIITMEEVDEGEGDGGGSGSGKHTPRATEAVAVGGGGLILAVGSLEGVVRHADRDTEMIYLNNQTLMPGFIECHQHAIICATRNSMYTDIGSTVCSNYSEVSRIIKERVCQLKPGEWGKFLGWDPELVRGLPILTKTYLDRNYSSTVPIVIIGQSWHVAWANSAALKEAGITRDSPDPPGGTIDRDGSGIHTGKLLELPAIYLMIDSFPKQNGDFIRKGFEDQWRYYSSKGFTTVTDLLYRPSDGHDELLKELADRPDCPIRLALYRLGHVTNYEDFPVDKEADVPGVGRYNDRLWEAGTKLFADGSPHCGTIATREPFLYTPLTEVLDFPKAPNYGVLNMSSEELASTIKHYHGKGGQLAIHSHGERASEQVLNAFEEALGNCGLDDRRHRMEHCGLTTVEQLARAAELGLTPSFFVDHLRHYGRIYKTDIFGDRVNRWTPLSEATRLGLTWTLHQDNPAFPGDALPFASMKTAITRCTKDDPTTPYGPEYRVSVHEALKAYTVNAAWQLHREGEMGTITLGKRADLVVLSKNPYKVDSFNLESIDVIETYLQGRSNGFATITTLPGTDIKVVQRK